MPGKNSAENCPNFPESNRTEIVFKFLNENLNE